MKRSVSPTPRRRSMLTGKIIPRCRCGKAVYAEGKCYGHYQSRRARAITVPADERHENQREEA